MVFIDFSSSGDLMRRRLNFRNSCKSSPRTQRILGRLNYEASLIKNTPPSLPISHEIHQVIGWKVIIKGPSSILPVGGLFDGTDEFFLVFPGKIDVNFDKNITSQYRKKRSNKSLVQKENWIWILIWKKQTMRKCLVGKTKCLVVLQSKKLFIVPTELWLFCWISQNSFIGTKTVFNWRTTKYFIFKTKLILLIQDNAQNFVGVTANFCWMYNNFLTISGSTNFLLYSYFQASPIKRVNPDFFLIKKI